MKKISIFSGAVLLTFFTVLSGCNQGGNEVEQSDNVFDEEGGLVEEESQESLGTTEEDVMLQIETDENIGEYLVDKQGKSLYLFKADSFKTSNCYDACAAKWPPLTAKNTPEAGEGVDASLISTFERKNGTMQVAYNGWPLYYFVEDSGEGEHTGQDVKGFGAEWYLVTPEGNAAHGEGHEK